MTTARGRRLLIVVALSCVLATLALGGVAYSVITERGEAQETRELSVQNCTTVNENTEAVYQLILAFKALADTISRDLPPDQKLEVRVEEPEYLDC